MAYTEKQWNNFQASLPAEDRTSYLDYLKETDPTEYSRVVALILDNLKKTELQSGTALSKIIDESSKLAGAKADLAGQKVAVTTTKKPVVTTTRKPTVTTTRKPVVTTTKAPVVTTTKAPITATTPTPALAVDGAGQYDVGNVTPAPNTSIPDPTGPQATEFYNRLKGKSTSGVPLTAEEKDFNNKYLQHRAAILGGLQFQGKQLTPEQLAEKDFLVGLGYIAPATPTPTPAGGTPTPTPAGTPAPTFTNPNNETVQTPDGTAFPTPTPTLTSGTPTPTPTLTVQTPDGTAFPTPTPSLTVGTPTPTPSLTSVIPTPTPTGTPAPTADPNAARQSAYDLLYAQFEQYGLGSLVEPLKKLITSNVSPAEFTLKLRNDPLYNTAYKKRFGANDMRVAKGLKAINEAEYLNLEDQYQNILRNAGLPESYWKRGDLGVQEGFTNFIANDVSAVELEDRVSTAQQRLIYANPEVSIALKNFYPDISNGDLLAYALDPTKGIEQIKRLITAAEIGSSAVQLGLTTNVTDAEYLARYGVNKAQAQQGYRTAAEILPTASKLGDIYARQGLGAYTQQTAEQEIFNVPGAAEAAAKRRKLSELEQASFSGRAGMGALARERAGAF